MVGGFELHPVFSICWFASFEHLPPPKLSAPTSRKVRASGNPPCSTMNRQTNASAQSGNDTSVSFLSVFT
jgi:hypothetical protein